MAATPAPVRPAATVVLLREGAGDVPFEVFFVKRHSKAKFMANAYVFPGGRVDDADADPALLARLTVSEPTLGQLAGIEDAAVAKAHLVAAIRETFEESGVLLARRGGEWVRTSGDERARWEALRERLNAGVTTFAELVVAEDLELAGEALEYFAHWITPPFEKRRYDTRFFVAFAPPAQVSRHDARETVDSCWLSPESALESYRRGGTAAFSLAPPTFRVLTDLAAHPARDAVVAWASEHHEVPTFRPHFETLEGELTLMLPPDPRHPESADLAEGERAPNRIVMRAGRWVDVR